MLRFLRKREVDRGQVHVQFLGQSLGFGSVFPAAARGSSPKKDSEVLGNLACHIYFRTFPFSEHSQDDSFLFLFFVHFSSVRYAPQFCATLVELLASRGITRMAAADLAGLSRPVFTRLIRGDQWPAAEHLAAIGRIAATEDERRSLQEALASDIAEALGLPRFAVAEDDEGTTLLRVPTKDAGLLSDLQLLLNTDETGRLMLETMIPAYLRKSCKEADAAELVRPAKSSRPRKNTGAPSRLPSLPSRSKAS